jgi:hypothetical protein
MDARRTALMFGITAAAFSVLAFRPRFPRAAACVAGWAAPFAALVGAPGAAWAQVETITPVYVTVERENVPMQCRIGSASYPVKTVTAGQVLKADGQTASMYRVEYPAGMSAFVKIEEASLAADGKTVTLTRPSRLMAPNAEGGVSWWYLLEKDLDAGTAFKLDKAVKGPDGKDAGYLVPAPVGSKGYIRREFVRQATQAEIEKLLGKAPAEVKPAEPKPAEPKPASGPGTDGTKPVTGPGVTNIDVKPPATPQGTTPGTPPATNPPVDGGQKPVEIVNPAHTDNPPSGTGPATAPPPPGPAPVPAKATTLKAVDTETLTKLYSDALKAPLDQVELDAVIAEFQRTIEKLEKEQGTDRLRKQLDARVRVLKMRQELQSSTRQANSAGQQLQEQAKQMSEELKRLESMRQYTVAGRLVASSVYDGRTLPLMYRVLSPEPTSTRTLAYVAPDATANLIDKVGKLVGVVGDSRFDESLRVNIIVPTRVDLLGTVGSVTPTPAPATPGTTPVAPATPAPTPATPVPLPDENK